MVVRLGYQDAVVVIDGEKVYVFDGRLLEASLEEVLRYAEYGEGVIPEPLKKFAKDIRDALYSIQASIRKEGYKARVGVQAY
ncbi:hypothetical protein PFDSM3638_08145 [Pyrococcus furiosus DSM 3638]|uniref:Uncharacterized protein n=2 Tax=Pyrococcus furiosus TaxID=2261 RepID=A0A5C0XRM9_PYRFU|nr:hypothetical protein [Pyrococcus furiosus]AFN05028.1 hypothetical protein PFC_10545 [Pyrococcus furiosus COM1]QEK79235.1 hypothetical protein PFDSM3638_08145 [Pyrococcus furiosus DSM 3638]